MNKKDSLPLLYSLSVIIFIVGLQLLYDHVSYQKYSLEILEKKGTQVEKLISEKILSTEKYFKIISEIINSSSSAVNEYNATKLLKNFVFKNINLWGIKIITQDFEIFSQYGKIKSDNIPIEFKYLKHNTTQRLTYISTKEQIILNYPLIRNNNHIGWIILPLNKDVIIKEINNLGVKDFSISFNNFNILSSDFTTKNSQQLNKHQYYTHNLNNKDYKISILMEQNSVIRTFLDYKAHYIYIPLVVLINFLFLIFYKSTILKSHYFYFIERINNLHKITDINNKNITKMEDTINTASHTNKLLLQETQAINKFIDTYCIANSYSLTQTKNNYLKLFSEAKLNHIFEDSILANKIREILDYIEQAINLTPSGPIEEIYIKDLLQQAINLNIEDIIKENIEIKIDAPDNLLLKHKKFILLKILTSIINNLISGIRKNGTLEISITSQKELIMISFKDNGFGYPEDLLNDSFSSKNNDYNLKYTSWSSLKKLTKDHNFNIVYNSEKGIGTQLILELSKEKIYNNSHHKKENNVVKIF